MIDKPPRGDDNKPRDKNNLSDQNSVQSRRDGKIFLYMLLGFFLTFATVDAFFVYTAVSSHTGVVTENAYEKGLDYNSAIAAADNQASLGWEGSITLSDDGLLTFTLADDTGALITGADVKAEITRPIQSDLDFRAALNETDAREYRQQLTFPAKGQWDIRVYVTARGARYQLNSREVINE